MVGSETALVDRPRLNVRLNEDHPKHVEAQNVRPLRVVVDSRGRVTSGPLMDTAVAPTLIFTTVDAPQASRDAWAAANVEVCVVQRVDGPEAASEQRGVDMRAVLDELGNRGVLQLMVEGGSSLHGSLLGGYLEEAEEGKTGAGAGTDDKTASGRGGRLPSLADAIHLYTGSKLIGASGKAWNPRPIAATIAEAQHWSLFEAKQIGGDVRLIYLKRTRVGGDADVCPTCS